MATGKHNNVDARRSGHVIKRYRKSGVGRRVEPMVQNGVSPIGGPRLGR